MKTTPYGTTFALWRAGCPDTWRAYTHHAFVKGLGDGSLSRNAFLHYLVQDYVFLVHFARAWSFGVVKAETLDEMKVCAGTVDALVNHEMALHLTTCAREGITEATLFAAAEEFENLAYTRYVMDAGLQGDFLDLMATLAPCCFGYGEIGIRLASCSAPDTPYREWISTYASTEYQDAMVSVGEMIDNAATRRLGLDLKESARWPQLQARFETATKLEIAFWSMGLSGA